ncbi:uncharacterized protein LOC114245146 isoform X2 [Bombyx mandarina]|uniref:Neural proliferation differentiation and control protein 1 n=2 Tax=Bombyx TaxID=7090 RepID=A0A8R2C817_BOMMO|nr:uncharacterized protein LOC101744279 isoform X2 [Bombyx mori]XP_028032983.1 uncharacterized protein LOC114245146 isoform X2 [Bombyx mandarina]
MHAVTTVLVAAIGICAIAKSPGATTAPTMPQTMNSGEEDKQIPSPMNYFRNVIIPKYMIPHYIKYVDKPGFLPQPIVFTDSKPDLLTKEIIHLNEMETDENDEKEFNDLITKNFMSRIMEVGSPVPKQVYSSGGSNKAEINLKHANIPAPHSDINSARPIVQPQSFNIPDEPKEITEKETKGFALTPFNKEYYEEQNISENTNETMPNDSVEIAELEALPKLEPRQIRQNPNLGKAKALVADDLDKLKIGLYGDDGSTNKPHHIHLLESGSSDPSDSIFGVALMAAIGTALTMAILGFAFGWYTLSKRAKAAADVDYPAYGVTGPTVDSSGDRKLAQSAHMYHYQHQKQQIIAMERNGLDQRHGSMSDPESDEENEEGDYTVYECPGFATTGDMEVKNPLFSEDATPATPGKCEIVKQQPKK